MSEENAAGDAYIAQYDEKQQVYVWVQRRFEPNPAKV